MKINSQPLDFDDETMVVQDAATTILGAGAAAVSALGPPGYYEKIIKRVYDRDWLSNTVTGSGTHDDPYIMGKVPIEETQETSSELSYDDKLNTLLDEDGG